MVQYGHDTLDKVYILSTDSMYCYFLAQQHYSFAFAIALFSYIKLYNKSRAIW